MNKILFILPFIFLFTLVSVFAELNVGLTVNEESFNLYHSQSKNIIFYVTHDNSFCSVTCDYSLTNDLTNVGVSDSRIFLNKDQIILSVSAPSKKEAKSRGRDEDQIVYSFNIECKESGVGFCTDVPDIETKNIIINYYLPPEEKSAKSYLLPQLENLKSSLDNLERAIYTIQTRLGGLDKNVLASDIKNNVNSVNSNFKTLQSNREKVLEYVNNYEYVSGKSIFQESWLTSADNYLITIKKYDSELDIIIKKHNEIAESIKNLNEYINSLSKTVKVLNKEPEFNNIASLISKTSLKFNNGDFISYSSIENEVSSIDLQLNSFKEGLNAISQRVIPTIKSESKKQYERLCVEKEYCKNPLQIYKTDLGDYISNFCEKFIPQIKLDFLEGNKMDYEEYVNKLKQINEQNELIKNKNEKIENYKEVAQKVADILNDNLIRIDYSVCFLEGLSENSLEEIESTITSCQKILNESIYISDNTEKSFLYSFKLFFKKLNPFSRLTIKKIKSVETLDLPIEPVDLDFSEEFNNLSQSLCSIDLKNIPKSYDRVKIVDNPEGKTLSKTSSGYIEEDSDECCINGLCNKCCDRDECVDHEDSYPIIFVHGHAFWGGSSPEESIDSFDYMIQYFNKKNYLNFGAVTPTTTGGREGEWGVYRLPVLVKTTYYYGGNVDSSGNIVNVKSKSESITTYANRLKDVVNKVKDRTNRNKVNLIAHSMGGLVARKYIQDLGGSSSVNKLIMIGTPNHGVYGQVDTFCAGLGSAKECEEMSSNSNFIKLLNQGDETPGNVEYYTIAGNACSIFGDLGDGTFGTVYHDDIVRVNSVKLDGSKDYVFNCQCHGVFGRVTETCHSNLLNPSKYPLVTERVFSILTS